MAIKPNVKCSGPEHAVIACFHLVCGQDNLTFQGEGRNERSRSSKRSLSAKKLNVTIFILSPMLKTPCGYDTWLPRYLPKTIPQN